MRLCSILLDTGSTSSMSSLHRPNQISPRAHLLPPCVIRGARGAGMRKCWLDPPPPPAVSQTISRLISADGRAAPSNFPFTFFLSPVWMSRLCRCDLDDSEESKSDFKNASQDEHGACWHCKWVLL